MKNTLKALAPKALLLACAIAFGSLSSPAKARLISQTPAKDDAGNLIYNDNRELVYDFVHTMYDTFDRPVLTYSTRRVSGNGCSTPAVLDGAIEDSYSTLFEPACNEHDYGYGNAPWQKAGFDGDTGRIIADDRFMLDLLQICKERFSAANEQILKIDCDMAAFSYAEGVKVFSTVTAVYPAEW